MAHVLVYPYLLVAILLTPTYYANLVISKLITLLCNYALIQQMFAHIALPLSPIDISEAFDSALSAAQSAIFVLLVDWGFNHILGELSQAEFALLLCTALLMCSEEQQRIYYREEVEADVLGDQAPSPAGNGVYHSLSPSPAPQLISAPLVLSAPPPLPGSSPPTCQPTPPSQFPE